MWKRDAIQRAQRYVSPLLLGSDYLGCLVYVIKDGLVFTAAFSFFPLLSVYQLELVVIYYLSLGRRNEIFYLYLAYSSEWF